MTKPDWGHGPNMPVLMFTEAEIRSAWMGDRPGYAGATSSDLAPANVSIPSLTAEQFISMLKQARGEYVPM